MVSKAFIVFAMKRARNAVHEPCGLTFARLSALTDEHVMAHVQQGHDDALAVIFDPYHRLVLIAFRILRDSGEAEDPTQAVFLEIFKASGQFDPSRGTTKGWIHCSDPLASYFRWLGPM